MNAMESSYEGSTQHRTEVNQLYAPLRRRAADAVMGEGDVSSVPVREADAGLSPSEEDFRRSLDDLPLGVRIVTKDGETVYANRVMPDLFDCDSMDELKGSPVEERYTPVSSAESQVRKKKRMRGEDVPLDYEIDFMGKDGKVRHLEVLRKEVLWKGIPHYQILYHDITKRKRLEEDLIVATNDLENQVLERTNALRKSEERYRLIIETANEGIWIINLSGKIDYANDRISEMLGYTREEIVGRTSLDFVVEKQRPFDFKERRGPSGGTNLSSELQLRHRDGSIIWVIANGSPLFDAYRQYLGNLWMLTDITEQKRLREELAFYAAKTTHLQEQERHRIAFVLHEGILQSLAALVHKMDLFNTRDLPKDVKALFRDLQEDVRPIQKDLLELSHGLCSAVLDVLGIEDALMALVEEVNDVGLTQCSFKVRGSKIPISTEANLMLFRIAQESLNNIKKHAQAKRARLALEYHPHKVRLTIADNGLGFDLDEVNRSVLKEKRLGLIGIRERVRQMGGEVDIGSKPGQGTTIKIELNDNL